MHVQIKLMDIFRDFLPPGFDVSNFTLEVQNKAMIHDIFSILGVPSDLPRVISCNGQIAQEDQLLNDGDVIAIFSPMFGG